MSIICDHETMNTTSEIRKNLNPTSLLDLKAELLRKQDELKRGKPSVSKSKKSHIFKKTSVWGKQNAGVEQRAQKDVEEKLEEEDVLTKSRKKLEAKSNYYEAMINRKDLPDEDDDSKMFLVDFEQKSLHKLSNDRADVMKKKQEKADDDLELPEPADPEEAWVDYTDSFGRSRRCMKKDLKYLQDMDMKLQPRKKPDPAALESMGKDLMSADMQRELVRQKWEALEKEAMTNPDGPIHYANVQHNEIRTHGTGFYQFSRQEESREEQMSALKQLREQTKEQRLKKGKLQEKKKSILKARLAKVKRRKLLREGKNPDEIMEDSEYSENEDGLIGPSVKDLTEIEPEILVREEKANTNVPVREWDIGKKEKHFFSEEQWLDNRRKERREEFAPPQMYNEQITSNHSYKTNVNNTFTVFKSKLTNKSSITENNQKVTEASVSNQETIESPQVVSKSFQKTLEDPMSLLERQFCQEVETKKSKIDPMKQLEESIIFAKEESARSAATNKRNKTHKANITSDLNLSYDTSDEKEMTPISSIPLPQNVKSSVEYDECLHQNIISQAFSSANNYGLYNSFPLPMYNNLAEHANNYFPSQCQSAYTTSANTQKVEAFDESNVSTPCSTYLADKGKTEQKTENTAVSNEPVQPQPAHFSAAPTKFEVGQVRVPRYERVNLYQVPDELPAPPSNLNQPSYPSMEDVVSQTSTSSVKQDQKLASNQRLVKKSQFDSKNTHRNRDMDKSSGLCTTNIPFVSPYVQKEDKEGKKEETVLFDPSIPPPNI